MKSSTLILSCALFVAAPVAAQTPDAAAVVAAERAFAGDRAPLGITGSFTKWSIPDAIVIGGGKVQMIRDAYPPETPRPADEPALDWWPSFAGIARSGDLGFTTGPMALNGQLTGHYFTVWRRQPDGSWKWIYDGGSNASAADAPGADSEPTLLATSNAGSDSPQTAATELAAVEARLAQGAATGQAAAHLEVMADDGRLYVMQRPPATGRDAFAEALAAWPETFQFSPSQGVTVSDAGDMAWTYGEAAWSRNGQRRAGHYVRLWQKRAEGWKLVLAQLIPAPPPAPPSAPAAQS
ncbi:MAG: nuclear transport factor 2 family protein [Brevundimonas sp.]|nr:MAG: nuclear transport factor 2 family protein [Brevundimonas sp.]